MKKLLVTAIGAAVAFGAFAGEISTKRFNNETTGDKLYSELPGGTSYWSEGNDATKTNTYKVSATTLDAKTPATIDRLPVNGLDIKTTFGKPLSVNIASGGTATNIPNSGLYFDSLVKFTVCEETPDQEYSGAKIIMWLQEQYEGDNVTGTNLMVRAGYLSYNAGALPPVSVTPTNYVCTFGTYDLGKIPGDFADQWHRVTIKAIPNITTTESNVPGFAIYIDGSGTELLLDVNSTQAKWDSSFTLPLTEGAKWLSENGCLFPSMVQTGGEKGSLTAASFDGTGSITDIVFTDEPMAFAEDFVAPKANVTIGSGKPVEYGTLAEAVAALSGLTDGQTGTLQLMKGMTVAEPLTINADYGTVVLDFAGCVLTNTVADAMITNNAALLVVTNIVGNGGIYCTDTEDGTAIYNDGGLTFTAGVIDGLIIEGENSSISDVSGGSFRDQTVEGYLAEGKALVENEVTGLFDVVDIVYYTVGFYDDVQGEGSLIGEEASVEAGTLATAPAAPTKTGYTFVDWTPSTNTAITANTNFYPTWSANTYTITYYDGENVLALTPASYTYGTGVTLPESAGAKTGYTFAGWYDNAGLTGDPVTAVAASETGNQTFYAKYTADTYTITFVNELGTDPASTNYTIESGTITLPEATTSNVGVQFDGWTNGTYTTATNIFTPSAANLANFTLYAAWSSTGSGSFDGGDGNSFTIDPGTVSSVEALTGHQMTETVAGSSVTYAQAYALGLIDAQGVVAELDATIEMKDGKVVVGLSSAPLAAYTITLKVYEKASLTAAWPTTPTQTYTLDDTEATTGFTPGSAGAGFYKTEITISNK